MLPVPKPQESKCIETFGLEKGKQIYEAFLLSEFRNARSILEQIEFLKKIDPDIKVMQICKVLTISTRGYYKIMRGEVSACKDLKKVPTTQLLTGEEEEQLIQIIHQHQLQNDCLTSRDVRENASVLYKARTGVERSFSRDWFRNFILRHSEEIGKQKAKSIEEDRTKISPVEVERYIKEVEEMMKNPPHPCLLLNFDETGFGRRPDKGKRKSVIISKKCDVTPYWKETHDLHHISVVSCVTAACTSLPPLFLSTRVRLDPDISDTFFERWAKYYHTQKGYMTQASMIFWIQNILEPYVERIRNHIGKDKMCYIIADGCTAHLSPEVNSALNSIGNIKMIFIPPHSSHITQMLDATIFSALKRRYSVIPGNKKFASKFTRKLMRIKNAYQTSITDELIRSGWETTGFKLVLQYGLVTGYTFLETFKAHLRSEVSNSEARENN